MSPITTHVLDTAKGQPAAGVEVTLELADPTGIFRGVGNGRTDDDGRVRDLLDGVALKPGTYRLRFETGPYFAAAGITPFHPAVEVLFAVRDATQHYHVPLLLSPFGYTTYRGS
jgi:5-hydroxyisourate hydrolase